MTELAHTLGIDWRLLLSQAVNFLLLLIVLRAFVYKPVLKLLKERKERIEEGIAKAKEADARLEGANVMLKEKMREAEDRSLEMLRETEMRAKKVEEKLLGEAHLKEEAVLKNAELMAEEKKAEADVHIREKAVELVKQAIAKTVEMDPKHIDEALIKEAVKQVKQ